MYSRYLRQYSSIDDIGVKNKLAASVLLSSESKNCGICAKNLFALMVFSAPLRLSSRRAIGLELCNDLSFIGGGAWRAYQQQACTDSSMPSRCFNGCFWMKFSMFWLP